MFLIDIQSKIINLAEITTLTFQAGQSASPDSDISEIEINWLRPVDFEGILDRYPSSNIPSN